MKNPKNIQKTNIIILKESDEDNNVEVMTSNKIFIDDNLFKQQKKEMKMLKDL